MSRFCCEVVFAFSYYVNMFKIYRTLSQSGCFSVLLFYVIWQFCRKSSIKYYWVFKTAHSTYSNNKMRNLIKSNAESFFGILHACNVSNIMLKDQQYYDYAFISHIMSLYVRLMS